MWWNYIPAHNSISIGCTSDYVNFIPLHCCFTLLLTKTVDSHAYWRSFGLWADVAGALLAGERWMFPHLPRSLDTGAGHWWDREATVPKHLQHFMLSPWSWIYHRLVAAEHCDNAVMVKQEQLSCPLLNMFSIHSTNSAVYSLD